MRFPYHFEIKIRAPVLALALRILSYPDGLMDFRHECLMDFRYRKMSLHGTLLSVIGLVDGGTEYYLLTTEIDLQKYIAVAKWEEEWRIGVQAENLTEADARQAFQYGKDCNGPKTIGIYLRDPVLEAPDCPQRTLNFVCLQDSLAFRCLVYRA